ncbi:hypothetical protein OPKNFCMD_3989 [Methylobacterium crusticola]|uniref:Uncharacterized protein n=1 Tax=Methylobacterium crusticola TaxID=1697972 RepID=A0ABQ4R0N3_9HYPH|nr:hypothetical protein [Methylobacterium crusticola]GJD51237.1 hypothetical protein OPKNFCMD_3989 [Methylobacterium crusticola]
MKHPILHRHPDGSAHYTHCYGENDRRPYRFEWQRPARPVALRRRALSRWVLLAVVSGVATAAAWAAMPESPCAGERIALSHNHVETL